MDLHLRDKVVLITGAATGLGRTLAEMFAAEGARVGVNYRTKPDLAADVVDRIRCSGGTAVAVQADVSSDKEVGEMFESLEAKWGCPDVLVNNAAFCPAGPAVELDPDRFMHTMNVNVGGVFRCCQQFARRAISQQRQGRIVNISSQAAFRGSRSGKIAYDSSKMGVVGCTRSLAREWASTGLSVNCVAPGLMLTDMIADAVAADPESYNQRVPMGRLGTTEEIANVVLFLASERAAYMTGATVDVSGGLALH